MGSQNRGVRCTSGGYHEGCESDASREKQESFRTSTLQLRHLRGSRTTRAPRETETVGWSATKPWGARTVGWPSKTVGCPKTVGSAQNRGVTKPWGPMYMRARRCRRCPHERARETRSKTHHGPPVAPPARAWCVLFRVSRTHVAMCYRCRGLRGRATDRKIVILVVPGGGACPPFS